MGDDVIDLGGGIDIEDSSGSFDWQGLFKTAGGVVDSIASTAATIYGARNSLRQSRESNAIALQRATLANQLEMTQAAGAVDIRKAQIAAEVARANAQTQLASYLPFMSSAGSSGGVNLPMLLILAGAGFLIYKAAK